MVYCPALKIWFPPHIGEQEIEPSPPARRRKEKARLLAKELTTWRRRYLPGMPEVRKALQDLLHLMPISRFPTGCHILAGKTVGAAGLNIPAPTAFWRLLEASGTRADTSGNGLDFTVANNNPGNGAGKIGDALYLTAASSQDLSRANSSLINFGAVDFSIASWIYLVSNPGGNFSYPMTKGTTILANANYGMYVKNTRVPTFWISTTGSDQIVSDSLQAAPALNTWFLFVGVFTTSNKTLRNSMNGVALEAPDVAPAQPHADTGDLYAGSHYHTAGTYIDGRLDAMAIWNVALTNANITDLYNGNVGTEYYSGKWN